MSDTIQFVRWSLGQRCRLRDSDEKYADPEAAIEGVRLANWYATALEQPGALTGIHGDVCVTSYTSARDPALRDSGPPFPSGGFVISETFKHVGGAAGLRDMCASCPANTWAPRPAGCVGTLYQRAHDPEVEEQLERILSRLGLEREVDQVLLHTRPRWYGLWARSPVPPRGLRLLRRVFSAIREEDDVGPEVAGAYRRRDHLPQLDGFLRATELAEIHGLPLHVSLAPPGHVDLGWYTVFPHCPLCKAEADLPRWRRRQPTAPYRCGICGTEYSPADTASAERDDALFDQGDLRRGMGPERFKAFAASYLVANGTPPGEAARIAEANEAGERRHEEELAAERQKAERHDRYVAGVLYAGLHPVYRRDDDDSDADADPNPEGGGEALFTPDEFLEVLRRCERLGIRVTVMFHRSASEEMDRFEYDRLRRPEALFAKWQSEGCRELFGGFFRVPDEVVNGFLDGKVL